MHAFAFQRFKVQTMRATVQRVIQSKLEVQDGVQILNNVATSVSRRSEDGEADRSVDAGNNSMTVAKRHAVVMLLTLRNNKYNQLREKNKAFNKWRCAAGEAQTFTMQVELARLAREVETVRFHEEVLRTNFSVQKTELESKLNILVGMIGQ